MMHRPTGCDTKPIRMILLLLLIAFILGGDPMMTPGHVQNSGQKVDQKEINIRRCVRVGGNDVAHFAVD